MSTPFTFGDCSVDRARRELRRDGKLVAIEPQVFDVLVYLIEHRDRVVTRDDLLAAVWGGRIVSESTLSSRINSARSAIGDSGEQQLLIRTVARKGVRFIGEVSDEATSAPAAAAPPPEAPAAVVSHGTLAPRQPDKPSIAVLPFTNMSGDPEQEYFSDGITEDIISALSRLRWFFVIARNSTFVYKAQPADVRQVGRDLGVRYVLEGSVRKSGQRVRITSQLLDATTSNQIWSERYDRELTDIFALQDEITASVTAAIEPKLLAAEGLRTEARSTEDLDAWDLVARALSMFWKLTAADSANAVAILRQAADRHPNYAPAHSMLAFALFASSYVGWIPPDTDRELAARLARRAAELDDSDPWAHMALGYFEFTGRNTEEAVRHFKAALDLNPNFAAAEGSIKFGAGARWTVRGSHRPFRPGDPHEPARSLQQLVLVGIAARALPRKPLHGSGEMGTPGRAAEARPHRRPPHPVRELAQSGPARGGKGSARYAAAAPADHLACRHPAVGSLYRASGGALHRRHAQGGTGGVRR